MLRKRVTMARRRSGKNHEKMPPSSCKVLPSVALRKPENHVPSESGQKGGFFLDTLEGDFKELRGRNCSTSTPLTSRLQSTQPPTQVLHETPSSTLTKEPEHCIHDSGLCEKFDNSVQSPDSPALFLHPSVLTEGTGKQKPATLSLKEASRRSHKSVEYFDIVCDSVESDLSSFPMPKLALLSQFEDSEDECDIRSQEGDSGYETCSFSSRTSFPEEDLSQTSDLDIPSVSSSFDFDSSVQDPESETAFEMLLLNYCPSEPDRLIGRKMGCEFVDIVDELNSRSMTVVLETMLSYLSEADLCRMSMVSRNWRQAVDSCTCASRRKKQYSDKVACSKPQKENLQAKKLCRKDRGLTEAAKPFLSVQQLGQETPKSTSVSPPVSTCGATPTNNAASKYWKEASKLRQDQGLRSCPRCRSPARADPVQERAWCSRSTCGHDFCTKCLLPFHHSRPCATSLGRKSKADSTVGSNKSKKNLRRL